MAVSSAPSICMSIRRRVQSRRLTIPQIRSLAAVETSTGFIMEFSRKYSPPPSTKVKLKFRTSGSAGIDSRCSGFSGDGASTSIVSRLGMETKERAVLSCSSKSVPSMGLQVVSFRSPNIRLSNAILPSIISGCSRKYRLRGTPSSVSPVSSHSGSSPERLSRF